MTTTSLPRTNTQDKIAVLVADDDSAVRATVSEVLAEGGFEVVAGCDDDRSAIDAARRFLPDVALIDVRMPGGGPSATREIRMVSPKTFVLGYSAFEDLPGVLEMIRAGAIGYVVKGSAPPNFDSQLHALRPENRYFLPESLAQSLVSYPTGSIALMKYPTSGRRSTSTRKS